MKRSSKTIPTTPKKETAFERKFMRPKELADRWGISLSSVYQGKADVSLLNKTYFGKNPRFLRSEVLEVERRKLKIAS